MSSIYKTLLVIFFVWVGIPTLLSQRVDNGNRSSRRATRAERSKQAEQPDSLQLTDSIAANDSTALADSTKQTGMGLEAPVDYTAKDSIVMTAGNMAYLFGDANVKYQQIELKADQIDLSMDSSLVYAKPGLDSIGEAFGFPVFKDGEQEYESKSMSYNFKSKKGYITDVITEQGEGYVIAGQTKKMPNDEMYMNDGKYTTCDLHDHPHFYFQLSKAKVRPGKNIVAGPAYLVLEGVPLPLAAPFFFFPFSNSYSSGVIFPTFGEESSRGFFLRDGGYYFALSDYIDLAVTGELYTKGSWGLQARSSYKKRYRYSGNFNLAYLITKLGEKDMPDYSLGKDFKINWTHSQDPKANPYRTFSASVNFGTSSFDRNQATNLGHPSSTENTKASSVNISQRFPNFPLTLSATMNINQRSQDSSVSVTLPTLNIALTRVYPFRRKAAVGAERWYEKISLSYNGDFRNTITTKDNLLFKSNLMKDWKNGMQHTIPVSATFSLFKYINISPSFNYKERWYTSKVEKTYDPIKKGLTPSDTTWGFNRVYDYNAAISASTTLYGFYKPLPFLGDKVQTIRHRFDPSVSFSAAPDFGDPRYGYHKQITYMDYDGEVHTTEYSPYEGQMFNVPGKGKQGNVNFSIDNNIEMKVKSDRDTTGFRKISLVDKLTLGMSYNLAADSFQWSNMNAALRLKLSKQFTLNLNGVFDTYTYGYDEETKQVTKVNVPRWRAGKGLGRLMSTGTSFSYTFNNDTFKKLFGPKDEQGGTSSTDRSEESDTNTPPDGMGPEPEDNPENPAANEGGSDGYDGYGYMINKVPWSLSFSYSMSLGYDLQEFVPETLEYKYKITNSLSFNGNIQPTKNWRFNFNATYDFDVKKISYMNCSVTRDLHCFQMSANFIPVGPYKSYSFSISVSSAMLKDLKYDQRNNYRDTMDWY
jgi:hypothetical protein